MNYEYALDYSLSGIEPDSGCCAAIIIARRRRTISFEDNIVMYNQIKGVFSFGK